MKLDKWTERFLDMADLVATFSKDPSTKVGCVITEGNRIVSQGFNGFARGVFDDYASIDRDEKLRRTLHAEVNAVLFARRDLTGCTAYITHPPCARCAALLIQAGVKEVVVRTPEEAFASRWADDFASAGKQFDEAGVGLHFEAPAWRGRP